MISIWKLQDAKARFSELVEKALSDGPQHVTRRGQPAVVVLSESDFSKIQKKKRPKRSLVELMNSCPAPEIFDYIDENRRDEDFGREDPLS